MHTYKKSIVNFSSYDIPVPKEIQYCRYIFYVQSTRMYSIKSTYYRSDHLMQVLKNTSVVNSLKS